MIREELEELEEEILSPLAAKSGKSKGRLHPCERCDIRTEFQRDRDRILHCKSFRRLKHKTQVFISPEGDHYRTRLTHTLEVSQIARTIARSLRLNEDLTEAISLGHDLGHTPFGHTGERLLDSVSSNGFRHNIHSLRVVDILENGKGLNLTQEVRDGIVNHTGPGVPAALEGQIVALSDRIAYINHDIDDAIRAKIISREELPKDSIAVLGDSHPARIDTMVKDVIYHSMEQKRIGMSESVGQATEALRDFMFRRVYITSDAKAEEKKAMYVLRELFRYFMEHPRQMPGEYIRQIPLYGEDQAVCDYIAGMTDNYAIRTFRELFVPSSWKQL
jgi:dGTPase